MFYIKQVILWGCFVMFLLVLSQRVLMTKGIRTGVDETQTFPFLGINYPWYHYGHDFGLVPNVEHNGVSNEQTQAAIEADFAHMQQQGVQMVRWFILPDGRASPEFDAAGNVTGLDDYFYRDLDAALAIAEQHNIKLIAVLFDFHWFDSKKGVETEIVTDPNKRKLLFDHALTPLLERYSTDERIVAWDIINEPEWAMTMPEGVLVKHPISAAMMQDFVREVAELIHDKATQPVTVGSASLATLEYWTAIPLDFYQFHYYDKPEALEEVPSYSQLGLNQPVMVGEFATLGGKYAMTTQLDTFWSKGYQSALAWSYRADDDASDFQSQAPLYCEWAKNHILGQEKLNCLATICPDHLDSVRGAIPVALKACSPDGTRYARELEPANQGKIGIFDQSSDDLLTIIETNESNNKLKGLAWSPDSSELTYMYHDRSGSDITLMNSHTAQPMRLINAEKLYHYMEYSPDGRYLLLAVSTEKPDQLDPLVEGTAIERLYLPLTVK